MNKDKLTTAAILIALLVCVAVFLYQPYREKEAFNKFKGKDQPEATYFDAVFSKLRITSQ